jgi:hypothetical protein
LRHITHQTGTAYIGGALNHVDKDHEARVFGILYLSRLKMREGTGAFEQRGRGARLTS